MALIKFILWSVIVFYVLGWLARLLLRSWLKSKIGEQANAGRQGYRQQTQTKKEGAVTVEQIEVTEKQVNTKVGEYVEYEEIEATKSTK